jgi:two-component sensor histidine kinase
MPGMDGLETLVQLRKLPACPPVVYVTGSEESSVAVAALKAGAADFVIKTVGESFFDHLASTFRQALDRVALEAAKLAAEAELREVNARLEMLLREVHHRIANSLQMVSSFVAMQAAQTPDAAARAALEVTRNRIQAVSQVHHRLYTRNDVAAIDLDEYLATLVDGLRASLPRRRGEIALTLRTEPVEVTPDQAVSIGVIVNELVNNAIKYAFPEGAKGTIEVVLARQPDGYSVTVGDDGRGIEGQREAEGTGLGMRIVDAIAQSLRTQIERVDCSVGTCHRLTVSL